MEHHSKTFLKYVCAFALLFSLSISKILAQNEDPVRKDMYIHLVIADSNEVGIKKVKTFLSERDYTIDSSKTTPFSFSTHYNYKKMKGNNVGVKLEVKIKGHDLRFGIVSVMQTGSEELDKPQMVEYKSSGVYFNKIVWKETLELVRRYPHSRLYFSQNEHSAKN